MTLIKSLSDDIQQAGKVMGRLWRRSVDWTMAGLRAQPADIEAELLRHSLLDTTTLVMLALSMSLVALTAIAIDGEPWTYAWLLAELLIGYAKLSFQKSTKQDNAARYTAGVTGSIIAGLAGGMVLGIAGYQCVATGSPLLILLSGICLSGLVAGTAVRAAGTPRYAILMMCVMALPYSFAALISPISHLFAIGLQMPLLLGGLIIVLREDYKTLSSLYLAQRENRWLAHHDLLTGLPNRTMELKCFDDLLRQRPTAAVGGMPLFTVFCLDLDGFKNVNDNFGHEAGDAVLVAVAGRLRGCIRDIDFLFRVGGDEFVMLLPSISPVEATAVADRIIKSISGPFDVGNNLALRVGISIGSAGAPTDGKTADQLLRSADRAMYEAKRRGKGIYITLPPIFDAGGISPPVSPDTGPDNGRAAYAAPHFPLPFAAKSV